MCWYNSVIFSCEILLNTFHLSFFTHLYHISPGNWSFCDDSTTSPPLIMIKLVETKTNTLHLLKEVQYIPGIAIKTAEIYININKSHKWPLQNNTDGNIWPVWDWMFIKRRCLSGRIYLTVLMWMSLGNRSPFPFPWCIKAAGIRDWRRTSHGDRGWHAMFILILQSFCQDDMPCNKKESIYSLSRGFV